MFKKIVVFSAFSFVVASSQGEDKIYEPTWESLDSRVMPGWFLDAKFGIFIHWGLYSVPAYAPRGSYAEWYWHSKDGLLQENEGSKERPTVLFHKKMYGDDVQYPDFRSYFKCELFDPEQWAKVFKRSGAKYVVLTAKHHDGYCLWPSRVASESYGIAWNSVDSGPGCDLVRELTTAVRSEGLRMGLYYSLWEWFNPLWPEKDQPNHDRKLANTEGLERYIHEVMYPQFKQIVLQYEPSLIFSDGDWWMDDELWQTKPLLAWLFNNAPNKDEVVINDRWGKVRDQHGGYYSSEYGSSFKDLGQEWEECRGIGKSFGVNRIETSDDYNSVELLLCMLCDIVSRGGNLLLDIGPTADGRIPPIMEDRLLKMGDWLKVNGEAIYGTERWVKDCQWSEGQIHEYSMKEFHNRVPDPIIEMAKYPREGQARKECYFTAKGDTVYALLTLLPDSGKFVIRDIAPGPDIKVTMLGVEGELKFRAVAGGIEVELPSLSATSLPCRHIYTLKILNNG